MKQCHTKRVKIPGTCACFPLSWGPGVRASVSSNLIFGIVALNDLLSSREFEPTYAGAYRRKAFETGCWLKATAKVSGAENFFDSLCRNLCRIGDFSTKASTKFATKMQNQRESLGFQWKSFTYACSPSWPGLWIPWSAAGA